MIYPRAQNVHATFLWLFPECTFCPCCKLLQWVQTESRYQVHQLPFWSQIFHKWCNKINHFISYLLSTCSVNSNSRPTADSFPLNFSARGHEFYPCQNGAGAIHDPVAQPVLFMAALCNRGPLYFCHVFYFYLLLLSSSSSSFPRLISAATDWMSTILLHMAWL